MTAKNTHEFVQSEYNTINNFDLLNIKNETSIFYKGHKCQWKTENYPFTQTQVNLNKSLETDSRATFIDYNKISKDNKLKTNAVTYF